ncbi:MAG: cell division protein FtsA [Oceanicaulis sp.]
MGMMSFFKGKAEAPAVTRKPGVFAALDIGAAKTICFIAKTEPTLAGLRPRVIGVGHQSTRGVRAGAVVDMEAAAESIRAAVVNAERMAGHTVTEITLAASAGAPGSSRIAVDMDIADSEVTDRDLRRILGTALREHDEPGRVILHALPLSWRVDGHRGVRDPRGMFGKGLGVDLHVVSAQAEPLQNLIACVERCQLSVAGVAATPYASGLAALSPDEMELGAVLVDMGAHTTTLAVFAEGALQHVDALPVGGAHVTSDIARGLQTPITAAERIKALYGCALDSPDDDQVMIETPPVAGGQQMVQQPRALLNAIIRPRLEEIFELLRDRLEAAGADKAAGRRLVLTGGASQLPGTGELAGRVLGKSARVGRPEHLSGLGDAVAGPGFSACAGVIHRCVTGPVEAISGPPRFIQTGPRRRAPITGERGPKAVLRWFAESF